jgi:hypothetical protein
MHSTVQNDQSNTVNIFAYCISNLYSHYSEHTIQKLWVAPSQKVV